MDKRRQRNGNNKTEETSKRTSKKGAYIFREAKIPQPQEEISKKHGWCSWGSDNLYPQFLWKLFYESAIHSGIVNTKVTFITSGGLVYEGPNQAEFDEALKNGRNDFSLDDIMDQVARDNEVTNAFCYYFKKNPLTGVWYLKPMDIELIRKDGESDDFFHYSEDWSKPKQDPQKTGYKTIASIFALEEDTTECLFYVQNRAKQYQIAKQGNEKLTKNFYPIPVYSGAISAIMADEEMNFFHYSEVVNGFKGGTMVSLNDGVPDTIQEENKIINEIKGEASNRETQGGLSVIFNEGGKETAPTVLQLNGNNLDSRYLLTQEHLRDAIMVAHSVITPSLFGVKTPGQLGNTQELLTGYMIFQTNYTRSRQDLLTDSLTFALKELNGFQGSIKYNQYIPEYLKPQQQTTVSSASAQFSEDIEEEPSVEDVLELFASCGIDRSEKNIVDSREMQVFEGVEEYENEYLSSYIKQSFANGLTENQNKILQMIGSGQSYMAIKEATGLSAMDLTKEVVQLKVRGLIETPDGEAWKVTTNGNRAIADGQQLSVLYSYELRPDAPALVKGGESRPFCQTLIGMNRLYTRQEIDTISSAVSRNVWLFRGGWYHDPTTDKNQPSCRHYWKQNIVID